MLLDQLNSLHEKLRNYDERKRATVEASRLSGWRSDLTAQETALQSARLLWRRVTKVASIADKRKPFKRGEQAAKRAAALLKHFDVSRDLVSGDVYKEAMKEAASATKWFQEEAVRLWSEATAAVKTDRVKPLQKIFGSLTPFKSRIEELKALQDCLMKRAEQPPASDEEHLKYFSALEQFEQKLGSLPLEQFKDPEIRAFLTAATSSGANISLLTDKVRAWLLAESLSDTFRILAK